MILALVLLAAQRPGVLAGRVTDALSGAPVVAAVVAVEGAGAETLSGADGSFVIRALAPGRYTVRVRRLGYAPAYVEEVRIANGIDARVEVALAPLPVELTPVLAAGAQAQAARLDHAALVARGATLDEALAGWEGVTVVRRGPGPAAPMVRGSHPSEVLVLVDGAPLNDPFTGVADLRRLGTRDVAAVSLYPGAQGARFGGRALAGVIAVETLPRSGAGAALWGGSYGAAGARLGLPFASLEGERLPDRYPVRLPPTRGGGETLRTNALVREVRGGVRWGTLGVQLYGSRRGLSGTLSNPTPGARADDRWAHGSFRWRGFVIGGDWFSTHVWDLTPPVGGGPAYHSRVTVRGVEAGWRDQLGLVLAEAGARLDRFTGDIASSAARTRRGHLALHARQGAGGLTLTPSARLDLWSGVGSPALSLRGDAAFGWRPVRLSLSAGSSAAPPVPADLIFHEGVGVAPNPALLPERVPFEVEGGLSVEPLRAGGPVSVSASVRGYAGHVRDYVVWAPDFRFVWSPRNFDVRRRGFAASVGVSWPAANLEAQGSAAVQRVTYDYPGAPQVIYRPRDTESARLGWERGNWRASLAWNRLGVRYPNHGGTNPLAPVSTWDLGARTRVSADGRELLLQLDLRDLTDRRAAFIHDFPSPGRSLTLRCEITTP